MNARLQRALKCVAALCGAGGLVLAPHTAATAPVEYSISYVATPGEMGEIFGPSGFGRFTYDPRTQLVAGLTWDFGPGYAGGLAAPESDATLGSILLETATEVTIAQRRELFGFFDYAQWDRVPFLPLRQQSAYHFQLERGGQFPHDGAFKARERNPQTFPVFFDRFDDPARVEQLWDVNSGEWTGDGAAYQSRVALATAVTTINAYETTHSTAPSSVLDDSQPYSVTARLMNRGTSAQSSIGLVYNYRDAANFNEVTFGPTGAAQLREIRSGTPRIVAADGYAGGARLWIDVELRRRNGRTSVNVNGKELFTNVPQSTLPPGRVGLVTHATTGTVDDVRIHRPLYRWPFKETFSAAPQGWRAVKGQWTVESGAYVTNVQQTSLSLVSAYAQPSQFGEFGFRARMLNPYGAAGNQVGLVWNGGKHEIVFSPSGEARLNRISSSGAKTTLLAVPIQRLVNQWFEVELDVCRRCVDGWSVTVKLNGLPIFENLQGPEFFPDGAPLGEVGLVTHWSPGRFDDVEFRLTPFPQRYLQYFDRTPFEMLTRSGAWELTSGTYTSRAIGQADLAVIGPADVAVFEPSTDVDFVYRASLRNEFGGAGNLIGLVTDYSDEGDYQETVFSGAGQVYVNQVIKGVRHRQATGTYDAPAQKWFDVEIRRVGTLTNVRVNGRTVLAQVPQGQMHGGRIGLVTHWTRGGFDDLSWQELKTAQPDACDFCDNFNGGAATRWQPVAGSWAVQSRQYAGRGVTDLCALDPQYFSSNESLIRDLQASDVDVEMLMRVRDGLPGAFVLRSSGPGNQIRVFISNDWSKVSVQELRNCQVLLAETLAARERLPVETPARFRVQLIGNYLRVWRNDHLLGEQEFPFTATSGSVGVSVSDGGRAEFDDVRVKIIE
jgi:hypothetical protein